jgi:hypothetical protein
LTDGKVDVFTWEESSSRRELGSGPSSSSSSVHEMSGESNNGNNNSTNTGTGVVGEQVNNPIVVANRPPKPTNLPLGLTLRDIQNGNLDVVGTRLMMMSTGKDALKLKCTPVSEDYDISVVTLGVGINGKVVECTNKQSGLKYALKVLRDNAKARREVELHWRASGCKHIVSIIDVYQNNYKGAACLLVIMEW